MRWILGRIFRRMHKTKALVAVGFVLMLLTIRHFLLLPHPVKSSVRVFGYSCVDGQLCGGLADRQKGIVTSFLIAAIFGVKFKINMPSPCDLGFFLSPTDKWDWKLDPPGIMEEVSARVQWVEAVDGKVLRLVKAILSQERLDDTFDSEYVFLTTNMETVAFIQNHKLADRIPWVKELSVPEVYKRVLRELFTLMPGPQTMLDAFRQSLPPSKILVCAQMRVGIKAADQLAYHVTPEWFLSLAQFLVSYNDSRHRFLFASDSTSMLSLAHSHFPPDATLRVTGPRTHLDQSTGSDACGGFRLALVEQYALSTCDVLVISESGLGKMAAFLRGKDEGLFLFHYGRVDAFRRGDPFPSRKW